MAPRRAPHQELDNVIVPAARRIVKWREAPAITGAVVHTQLIDEAADRLEVSLRRREMQGCSLVVVTHFWLAADRHKCSKNLHVSRCRRTAEVRLVGPFGRRPRCRASLAEPLCDRVVA